MQQTRHHAGRVFSEQPAIMRPVSPSAFPCLPSLPPPAPVIIHFRLTSSRTDLLAVQTGPCVPDSTRQGLAASSQW